MYSGLSQCLKFGGGGHILLGGDNVPPALVEIGLTGGGGALGDEMWFYADIS